MSPSVHVIHTILPRCQPPNKTAGPVAQVTKIEALHAKELPSSSLTLSRCRSAKTLVCVLSLLGGPLFFISTPQAASRSSVFCVGRAALRLILWINILMPLSLPRSFSTALAAWGSWESIGEWGLFWWENKPAVYEKERLIYKKMDLKYLFSSSDWLQNYFFGGGVGGGHIPA